jgi:hypothetical protein
MLWVMGANERQPCASNVAPQGATFESTIFFAPARNSSQVAGAAQAGLGSQAGMPTQADHIQQERPAVELSVHGALFADRWQDVIDDVFRDVIVPGLDDIRIDEGRHFDERRLPYVDVPCALLILGFGDKPLGAEAFDRGDLIIDPGELGVHGGNAWMKVVNPLVERRRQRPIRRESRPHRGFRNDSNAGQS